MNPPQIKVNIEVVDKRRKDGWFFGPSFYITMKFLPTPGLTRPTPGTIREYPVPASQFYGMTVGEQGSMTMYRHADGLYYHYQE